MQLRYGAVTMRSSLFLLASATAAAVVFLAIVARGESAGTVTIEWADVQLVIPQSYIYKSRFPWIGKTQGLDSKERSFMIQLPVEKISSIFQPPVGAEVPANLTVAVSLLTQAEKANSIETAQIKLKDILDKRGAYAQAYARFDKKTGYYLVYMDPRWPNWWDIFSRSPFGSDHDSINPDDLIARCGKDEHIGVQCNVSRIVLGDMMVQFSLPGDYIRYHEAVTKHLADLLQSWRIQ